MHLFLFDIDGTLIRAGGAGRQALDRALTEVLGTDEASKNVRFDGKTDRLIIREILHQNKTPDGEIPRLMEAILEGYLRFLPQTVAQSRGYEILPGIVEMLQEIEKKTHFRIGLATGNVREGAKIKLARGNLNRFFKTGGFGCDSENRGELVKIGIERACQSFAFNFLPENIFIIGDTEHDVHAGKACGVKTIAVATGSYAENELANCAPDFLLSNFSDWRNFMTFFA